jgi:adenosylhomocysteinase
VKYDIKDKRLSKKGRLRIEWAGKDMPVLDLVRKRFKKQKPLRNIRIGACLHVTTETANLMIALKDAGSEVVHLFLYYVMASVF